MEQEQNAVKRPLLAAGLTAVAVTTVVLKLPWWLSLSCVILLLGYLWWRRRFLCAVTAVVFLLLSMGWRHWYWLSSVGLDETADTLSGVVVDTPAYGEMYTVRVTASSHLRRGTLVMMLCNGDDRPYLGSSIAASVRLRTVADNQSYYASRGAFVCAFPEGYDRTAVTVTQRGSAPLATLRQGMRRYLMTAAHRVLGAEESSIVAALCFGDRDFLSEETVSAFQGSGLGHLLVVSGLHLSMVMLAVRRFVRRLGMRPTCFVTLLVIWLFAWLVGISSSVFRAALMGSVWLVGMLCFCHSDGLNSLGLAALLLLAVNPYTVWNAGFQLSFAATLGVLLLAPRLVEPQETADPDEVWWYALWRWLRHTVVSGAAACLCALLFTLPIAAYHYGGLPLTSVVSNVLAVPVGGLVLLLGWLGAVCGWLPFLGWLTNGILWLTGLLCRYLSWVARLCSPDWAWVIIDQPWQWLLLGAVCALVVCAVLWRIPWRQMVAGLSTLVVLTMAVAVPLTVTPFRVTVIPSDNAAGFLLQQGTHCALLMTDAAELDEVVYTTAPFSPDVVFVGTAMATTNTFPSALTFSTDSASLGDVIHCPVGSAVTLWRNCCLMVVSDGCWRVQVGEDTLWICTDLTVVPPVGEGLCVYVGGVPTCAPQTPYAAVCSEAYFRRHRPTLTGEEMLLIHQSKTFTPRRGEWRLSL